MNAMEQLRKTVARLRAPGGCPWDREQTHGSIADCLLEECCELLEAIDRGDFEHMREELGDVLLQVVLHAQMAEDAGHFNLDAVAAGLNEKIIRRHPHIFGKAKLKNSKQVLRQWDEIKKTETHSSRSNDESLRNLPRRLPALLYARDVFRHIEKKNLKAASLPKRKAITALSRKLDETGAGRRLFEVAAACRLAGIDPESALRRFARRIADETENDGATR